MATSMLVRIKPNVSREVHVFENFPIKKTDGWVRLPAEVAKRAAVEPLHDTDPEGPKAFDVQDPEGARVKVEAETRKVEPAGTPERPKEITPILPAADDRELQAARKAARSKRG